MACRCCQERKSSRLISAVRQSRLPYTSCGKRVILTQHTTVLDSTVVCAPPRVSLGATTTLSGGVDPATTSAACQSAALSTWSARCPGLHQFHRSLCSRRSTRPEHGSVRSSVVIGCARLLQPCW